jgi:hypothetical protein
MSTCTLCCAKNGFASATSDRTARAGRLDSVSFIILFVSYLECSGSPPSNRQVKGLPARLP